MSNRTWIGTTGSFTDAASWSPAGVPVSGDTAVINSGNVTASGLTLGGLAIQLNGNTGSEPIFGLTNSTLAFGSSIVGTNSAPFGNSTIDVGLTGTVANSGIMTFNGSRIRLSLAGNTAGTAGLFQIAGTLNAVGASPNIFTAAGAAAGTLQNDGSISVWNPSNIFQSVVLGTAITGSGIISLHANAVVDVQGPVGANQSIRFTGGSGAAEFLQFDAPSQVQAKIVGFAASDLLTSVTSANATSFTYTAIDANNGTLALKNGNSTLASYTLGGQYTAASFSMTSTDLHNGKFNVSVSTTAAPPQRFNFTDATLNLSGTESGDVYTGPVAGLDFQYLWSGADAVAMSAGVPNVFIKGGAGGDALAVSSGINVLDGAGGSNFLIGGTGAGSQDTFFVDARGGVETWSTIVNFHLGDSATIFGFHAGLSTRPYTANDGAGGFTGVTIHSEINGQNTGILASMTFTGLTVADANAHFTITSGTLSQGTPAAIDYLLIQYDH